MRKIISSVLAVGFGLGLSGCASAIYDAYTIKSNYSEAELKKARSVKFMPDARASKRCKYISMIYQDGVAYDMREAQISAEKYLVMRAVKLGGNTVSITDRLVTKNKMTKKINLGANIYKCRR